MKEALSFIEQHYSEDISIEDISSFCGLNRSYFSKVFRDTMGESPQGFLLHYIMMPAQLWKSHSGRAFCVFRWTGIPCR